MKRVLFATLIACTLLCVSCNSHKRVWYLQDASDFATEQIATQGQIRIQPLDRLTIIVNSKDPELAVPFNAATGYTALTPLASASISSSSALQVRTVDEKGYLQMPIIGELKVVGLTRGELSQLIADKIIAGGYINDPTVNVQFVDMKFSVLGEVTHGGNFAITHDKLTIFDALAMAGDMTIFGQRSDVMVYREVDGVPSAPCHKKPGNSDNCTDHKGARETAQIGLPGHKGRNCRQQLDISCAKTTCPIKRNQHQYCESCRTEDVQKTCCAGSLRSQHCSQT